MIRHLACSCLFAREHNISGDEKSSDHVGKIEEFNSATTSINRYHLERLEQYFVANSVPADSAESHKRRAILISVIGAKAYDFLSDLCSPIPPSEKTYAQLTTILKNHFAPKKLVIAARYQFHNCTQREGESVTAFAANLKHLASTCQFGTHLNEALRDRFVCGLRSKETQKKLLTEEHTFDATLKVALGAEAAEKDVAALSQESNRRNFQPTQRRKGPGKRGKLNSSGSNQRPLGVFELRKNRAPTFSV